MNIQVRSETLAEAQADWLIVAVAESSELTGPLTDLNTALDGQLERLREADDLSGKVADAVAVLDVPNLAAKRLLIIGVGPQDELCEATFNKAMMTAARRTSDKHPVSVAVCVFPTASLPLEKAIEIAATAFTVGSVGQDLYQEKPSHTPFSDVTLLIESNSNEQQLTEAARRGAILGEAVNLTRELVNRHSGDIYPASFAARAEQDASECGLSCRILDEDALQDERMGSLLAVAVGSDQPARVVVLEHQGGGDGPTLALVGKGVTFDSGGLSLKPSDGMKTMKCDMAGAASVLGAMTAIAKLNLPVNVVGYMGLVENMVSGSSYKLGDVLTARNGTTIEVLNTDAEGRLVLADVLNYAADQGADRLIDLATLTGACVVALGEEITGVFSNDQSWCDEVLAGAKTCGEGAWQMPMFDEFSELLNSDVADCKNIGTRWGGAITAAKFLEKFVCEKPWVHLDIAGPSFASSNKPHREGGGTGCMVRTLVTVTEGFGK